LIGAKYNHDTSTYKGDTVWMR